MRKKEGLQGSIVDWVKARIGEKEIKQYLHKKTRGGGRREGEIKDLNWV